MYHYLTDHDLHKLHKEREKEFLRQRKDNELVRNIHRSSKSHPSKNLKQILPIL